ncbi:hypothetical protein Pint_33147 [Pistacia integerrima]|uniref:Uncharacterized protein n=1 Tax=Pistacia integerrima TaxID=434235 RepID=A0ACC0X471_9ROSI|nr:hypothetical protein Pint_33147 [Pistacia integerrima]
MVFFVVLSLFSLFTTTISSSIFVSASSLVDDLHVLVALKQGFLSPEPALTSWNSSNPSSPCSWAGVFCSQERVFSLDLTDLDLGGSVSAQVSRLDMLTNLSLAGNNFTGGIEIDNLSSLQSLNISNNQFSGGLDWNYSSLSNLQVFDAYNNNFTALLPLGVLTLEKLKYLDLGGNYFNGKIPESYGKLVGLEYLSLAGNDLQGKIPGLGTCYSLTRVRLGQNYLNGSIPNGFIYLPELNLAELQNNYLSGSLPENGSMKSLTIADFSFNDFSGKLPESGQFTVFNASSFAGNPQLCGTLLNNPCNFTTITRAPGKAPGDFKLIFALGLLICSLIFATAAIIKAKSFKKKGSDSWKMTAFQKVEFSVSDILECVKDGNVIGRGGAGIVYHGKMPNGVEIAVKKLLGFGTHSHDHGFRAEIQTLGNIRHRNIVRLLAFCSNKDTNLLVYEYMRNGSLGEALHGKKEYAYTLRVDEKSDVYSFGVVLLELLIGRRPVGDFGDGVDIVQWSKRATNNRKEEVLCILDPRLTMVPREEAMHVLFIAMLCIQENSIERPTMREVVQMLSEFPRHSPEFQSSSSSLKTLEKEKRLS